MALETSIPAKKGAPKKSPTKLLRMRVSAKLYSYLTYLKDNTHLGASENDVAQYLLTEQLSDFRNKPIEIPEDIA